MGEPFLGDGVLEGFPNVVLAEQFREGAGAVFPGEDLVAHGRDEWGEGKKGNLSPGWLEGNRLLAPGAAERESA